MNELGPETLRAWAKDIRIRDDFGDDGLADCLDAYAAVWEAERELTEEALRKILVVSGAVLGSREPALSAGLGTIGRVAAAALGNENKHGGRDV